MGYSCSHYVNRILLCSASESQHITGCLFKHGYTATLQPCPQPHSRTYHRPIIARCFGSGAIVNMQGYGLHVPHVSPIFVYKPECTQPKEFLPCCAAG